MNLKIALHRRSTLFVAAVSICFSFTACHRAHDDADSSPVESYVANPSDSDQTPEPDISRVWIDINESKSVTVSMGSSKNPKTGSLTEIVDHLATLPALRSVHARANYADLTRDDYSQISRLRQLEDLYIYTYSRVSGPELTPLARLPHLKSLEFQEATVEFGTLKVVAEIKSLELFLIPFADDGWEDELKQLRPDLRFGATQNYAP